MKILLLMVTSLITPAYGWAECQIFASQQKVSWNTLSAAERQQAKGQTISLPKKQIQVQVVCHEPRRIRLFVGSDVAQKGTFTLGPDGEMRIIASHARVDENTVRLARVGIADAAPRSAGSEELPLSLNEGLAFMNGSEVYGKVATVTFIVNSTIKPGSIVERTTWRGNLKIKMDVQ